MTRQYKYVRAGNFLRENGISAKKGVYASTRLIGNWLGIIEKRNTLSRLRLARDHDLVICTGQKSHGPELFWSYNSFGLSPAKFIEDYFKNPIATTPRKSYEAMQKSLNGVFDREAKDIEREIEEKRAVGPQLEKIMLMVRESGWYSPRTVEEAEKLLGNYQPEISSQVFELSRRRAALDLAKNIDSEIRQRILEIDTEEIPDKWLSWK